MKFTIERAWVDAVGRGWYGQEIAYTYNLTKYDLDSIGEETRENVELWLSTNAGDFQSISDFHAVLRNSEIPWNSEEKECSFNDLVYPMED
jgi:hypothetical protein